MGGGVAGRLHVLARATSARGRVQPADHDPLNGGYLIHHSRPLQLHVAAGRRAVGHVTNSSLASDSGKGMYYVSMLQRPTAAATILVKTQADVNAVPAAIREAVRYADPRQSVHSIRSLEDLVSESLAPRRFGMRLLGFFGAIALFLAALGLYGVVSYSVTRRRREIGIRLALGAEQHEVMAMVGQGMRLVGIGAVIGIIGSLAGARWMQSQLFEVSPFDPLTILGMGAVLLLAAMLASYLPARRAMRVDPVIALRPSNLVIHAQRRVVCSNVCRVSVRFFWFAPCFAQAQDVTGDLARVRFHAAGRSSRLALHIGKQDHWFYGVRSYSVGQECADWRALSDGFRLSSS